MKLKKNLIFLATILTIVLSCNSQPVAKKYVLSQDEKTICDTLQLDTSIVSDIRMFNTNFIEPFHYSLSKIVTKDTTIDADPIYLNGLVLSEINSKSYNLVFSLKEKLKSKGYSIFVLENHFGLSNDLDKIGVLKTTDQFQILKQIETDGINYEITNDSLISIMKEFDKKYSIDLIGASGDWCEFAIQREPDDWMQLAREVYKVCPDVVEQGTGTIQVLADEMKKTKHLYFWWD